MSSSPEMCVAGYTDGRITSYDVEAGSTLWTIPSAHTSGRCSGVSQVALASNMRFVLSAGEEGEIRVWETRQREMVSHFKEHTARVNQVVLFPNDQYAVSVARDRCILTWDLRAEKRLTSHRGKHGGLNCIHMMSDQTNAVTGSQEKDLVYWDLRQPEPIDTVKCDEEILTCSGTKDDLYLVTGGTDGRVKLWDLRTRGMLCRMSGHSRPIRAVACSSDDKQLVSAGDDHSIFMWNLYPSMPPT